MKRSALLVPFALLIATPATVLAKDQAEFAIKSLNTPDPIFVTSGNSVPVSVTSTDAKALKKAVVRLNGLDVTSAFSIGADGALSGTPSGLVPGINTFEVFTSKGDKDSEARLRVARAKSPSFSCSLVSFSGASLPVANTVVTAASPVAATATVPSHCLVTGTIDAGRVGYPSSASAPQSTYTYTINWAVRLPDAWNNKFYYAGGGGLDGSVPNTANNTIGGYATASNDSGHNNTINNDPLAAGTGSFATDFEARTNFAYRAIDVTTQTAKSLIDRYYSDHPAFSYFQGCSMGGREAMMVTQKLPTYFDGSVIGDPGFKLVSMSTHEVYDAQVLASLAQSMGLVSSTGAPLAANTFTNQDLQLVSKAVLDACDALDGVVDGMVANFHQCTTSVVRRASESRGADMPRREDTDLPHPGTGSRDREDLRRPNDALRERQADVLPVDVGPRDRRLHQRDRLQHADSDEHRDRLARLEDRAVPDQPGDCREQRVGLHRRRWRRLVEHARADSAGAAGTDRQRGTLQAADLVQPR